MHTILPKVLFVLAIVVVTFTYAVLSVQWNIFPYPMIKTATATLSDLRRNWKNDLQLEPTRHLKPARHQGAGVTVRDDARLAPGPTFVTSMFDGQIGARLIAPDGSVLHEWPVNYTEIWPERDQLKNGDPVSDWNVFVEGGLVLPDGSIVIDFNSGPSLVRLDRCGEVIWKVDRDIHHAVHRADDGTFWVPLSHDVGQVSADGELLRRISIKKMMLKNDLHGVFFIQHIKRASSHPNDVEVLSASMAEAFPMFEAGDVLYSMRDLNLLIVFDPDTEVVKWYQHGPWLRQHDPDFLPDGLISVFNNRMGYDGSNLMVVDPATREVEVVYQAQDPAAFYTPIRGKHQYLDNGNFLVTEANSGRVFEVAPDREIVWEYINRYDDERVLVVSNAIRYDPDYFEVDDWSCSS